MLRKIVCFVLGIPITLISVFLVLGGLIFEGEKVEPPFIVLLLLGALLLFLGAKPQSRKKREQELQESMSNSENTKKQYKASHFSGTHMAGLPLAEGTNCIIGMEKDKFIFSSSGNDFNLNFEKITSIDVKTDTEIQQQYVSSIGGAVGGAILFGPLGAIIGGRAKAKRTTTTNYYMIFTYKKDDAIDYISFEIPLNYKGKATDFKRTFENHFKTAGNTVKVEL